jgi:hypothetical protein
MAGTMQLRSSIGGCALSSGETRGPSGRRLCIPAVPARRAERNSSPLRCRTTAERPEATPRVRGTPSGSKRAANVRNHSAQPCGLDEKPNPRNRMNGATRSQLSFTSRSWKCPVTPEVAGSSPVAPVLEKCLQITIFCCLGGRLPALGGSNRAADPTAFTSPKYLQIAYFRRSARSKSAPTCERLRFIVT